jgi:hypothetical protein
MRDFDCKQKKRKPFEFNKQKFSEKIYKSIIIKLKIFLKIEVQENLNRSHEKFLFNSNFKTKTKTNTI